jgi:hypothetical protein
MKFLEIMRIKSFLSLSIALITEPVSNSIVTYEPPDSLIILRRFVLRALYGHSYEAT